MNDETKTLLLEVLDALNAIPNTRYKGRATTYELASRIEKFIGQ